MGSREEQEEQAQAQRLAGGQAAQQHAQRRRRTLVFGGVVVVAVAIVVAAIAIGSFGGKGKVLKPHSASANKTVATVNSLLAGIPESGTTLGNPQAKITVTEFGDLECSVCDAFALPSTASTSAGTPGTGYEDQLINEYVRTGKVKLVYRSLCTATCNGPLGQGGFVTQQAAASAAGAQGKAWYYIELFYNEQGLEGTPYVTTSYLDGLAKQVPALNYSRWQLERASPVYAAQVEGDERAAATRGFNGTPTVTVQGPNGQAQPITGLADSFDSYVAAIKSVS